MTVLFIKDPYIGENERNARGQDHHTSDLEILIYRFFFIHESEPRFPHISPGIS